MTDEDLIIDQSRYHDAADNLKPSLRKWNPARGLTGDMESIPDKRPIMFRAWDLIRNSSTIKSIVSTKAAGVIGSGLKVSPSIDYKTLGITKAEAKEKNALISRYFNMWAKSEMSSADRKNNFYMLQMRIFFNFWVSGDCFGIIRNNDILSPGRYPFSLTVEGIDADMVINPISSYPTNRIAGGIEINQYGEEIAYHFRKIDLDSQSYSNYFVYDVVRIPKFGEDSGRRNVLHVHVPLRFNERRGVSALAPLMEPAKMVDRLDKSELTATVISSFFTAFIESESGNGLDLPTDSRGDIELGSGNVVPLAKGENVTFANPNRPNPNFAAFEDNFWIKMAASQGVPVEMVKMNYVSSYTAARAALLQAYELFKIDRQNFAFCFNQPIYEEFLHEIYLRNLVELDGFLTDPLKRMAWCSSNWVGDAMGMIDPVKEITAARMARQEQIKTGDQINRELTGNNYLETLEQLDDENQERIDRDMLLPYEYDQITNRIDAERKASAAENTNGQTADNTNGVV